MMVTLNRRAVSIDLNVESSYKSKSILKKPSAGGTNILMEGTSPYVNLPRNIDEY